MTNRDALALEDANETLDHLSSDDAICLLAFARASGRLELPDRDIEERLTLHHVDSVVALIDIVPIADYCGPDAERNLADVAWVGPRVRRHADLLRWMMRQSPVFPVPFGTFFKSFDSLTAFMRLHQNAISHFLDSVAGMEEWELRAGVDFDRPEILDELARAARPEWRDLSKGVRYMRVSRDRNALIDYGRGKAASMVVGFVEQIAPLTSAIRQHGAGRRLAADDPEPIARYAFLVPSGNVAKMHERIREIADRASSQHVSITLSGPWPAFSFRPDLNTPN